MGDFQNFNSTFFLSLATMTFGFLTGIAVYCAKSRCSSVKFCCLEIIRDIDAEVELEEQNLTINPPNNEIITDEVQVPTPISPQISVRNSPAPSRRQSQIDMAVADAVKRLKYVDSLNATEDIPNIV